MERTNKHNSKPIYMSAKITNWIQKLYIRTCYCFFFFCSQRLLSCVCISLPSYFLKVLRQNGVAGFQGAFQKNNNYNNNTSTYSVVSDNIRPNESVATGGNNSTAATAADKGDGERADGPVVVIAATAPSTNNSEGTNGDDGVPTDDNGRNNNDDDDDDDADDDDDDDIIVIHNRIINNTFTTTNQNGVSVTPSITLKNDMSDALYDNNKATSKTGKS